ncbi:2-succinyl-5-enolpyruvyl-6-hydroxy-3-cyclohexene-1-carboxylic-acid synthase [Roseofilum reptotaenium CS-1145]|uniref:2-succinyl-5-enolpyruvyl-6-hydroxy-3-cyclohexene-1-carboxylate synthase n=1 Tax=Roseofilum reptotaenium AO1-A TaxID=1925591 RepID=A0A1L9QXE2_9CYAN|nr:2-succinyl-5-enolpyruvyl-6-hydroxy-3-cyclohexene-1-carboxylic-acid synthase [Roseofilum reptotaenium]MDB9516161.1 2-succinyl-5-enolpyruvyl-6-hydroxy-3-cyclohexene-1-carboxylic-acid synthase [Roseofilum reptotaenium CS-1145]OJJ27365.1 2-succinyl-5-enolpyruvyl-6-hydroxy-3-cyclohexene-1-carboxylic-acid synthase [Roseofilum reptotaenium AO1-A]
MPIDFRNLNMLAASILVETLERLGLTTVIICPGSRSTPLTVAFAAQTGIEAIPILDERSAAFFALGQGKKSGLPTALVCTSGTAAANFYPAVIEAAESRVPLLLFTSDRPPELRQTHAGQTIDQVKLYGNYPTWQTELCLPHVDHLTYLRQAIAYGWERTLSPIPGPVHVNIPFREPLAPTLQLDLGIREEQFDRDSFFGFLNPHSPSVSSIEIMPEVVKTWCNSLCSSRGIIIAGVAAPHKPEAYVEAIAHLAKTLNFPVLAEGLSPVRNYAHLNPYIISTYDLILRNPEIAQELAPDVVIQIGDFPTSKALRKWLKGCNPRQWIIDPSYQNLDPLHNKTQFWRCSIEQLSHFLPEQPSEANPYLERWCALEHWGRSHLDRLLDNIEDLFEPKAAWLLSQILPEQTPIFISNSMPVRDVEWFWTPNSLKGHPYFNRGANGIDGILSTALGIAHRHQQPSVLLTGDLALLHDTNGFLVRRHFQGHLTIIVMNNNGGGIFENLPISQYNPPFEEFFGTPQSINFAHLCQTYEIEHHRVETWDGFEYYVSRLPAQGIRVLEIACDRHLDAQWRKQIFTDLHLQA